MATKVNFKKYLLLDGRWQFVPVLKIGARSGPEAVVIEDEAVKGLSDLNVETQRRSSSISQVEG